MQPMIAELVEIAGRQPEFYCLMFLIYLFSSTLSILECSGNLSEIFAKLVNYSSIIYKSGLKFWLLMILAYSKGLTANPYDIDQSLGINDSLICNLMNGY
jgi:ABC-type dipeptide/oligopeptide/nickel transport system permease component